MRRPRDSRISIVEVTLVTLIFSGLYILFSVKAVVDGFPAPGLTQAQAVGMVLYELLMFGIAAIVLHLRGWTLSDFKFSITPLYTAVGVALLVAIELAHIANWYVLGDILGGTDVLAEFAKNTALGFPFAVLLGVVNGIYEEFFLNRYLVDTLAQLGAGLSIGISVLVRISYHLYQGPTGSVSILLIGLVFTGFYWRFKQLWPPAFAHIASNVIAFA